MLRLIILGLMVIVQLKITWSCGLLLWWVTETFVNPREVDLTQTGMENIEFG